jgi:protein phosphatase
MRFASFTHKGNVREINEDSVYVPATGGGPQPVYFLAVADGMGGHNAGEVASAMAVRSMLNLLSGDEMPDKPESDPVRVLRLATVTTNDKVYLLGKQSPRFAGMGTTLTAALCLPDNVVVTHIGDSRAYMVHENGGIFRITRDHTLIQEFVDHHLMTQKQAERDPRRNILTRALGTEIGQEPDMFEIPWKKGNRLVLCSDGLTMYAADDEIAEIVSGVSNLDECAKTLGDMALRRGGTDNISLCIALNEGGAAL